MYGSFSVSVEPRDTPRRELVDSGSTSPFHATEKVLSFMFFISLTVFIAIRCAHGSLSRSQVGFVARLFSS